MSWTAERTETAKRLWREGLSCSQIAGELGGVTRNAVIGKLHRMGYTEKNTDRKLREKINGRPPKVRTRTKQTPARYFEAPTLRDQFETVELPPEDITNAIDFLALTETTCRWPIGDLPKYCGKQKLGDLPYCAGHCRMAYRKPEKREPREYVDYRSRRR